MSAEPQRKAATITKPPETFEQWLQKHQKGLGKCLPAHMQPDRMMRLVLAEYRKASLSKCDFRTVVGAMVQCVQLGLEPGTTLGHAYLVPFKNKKKGIVECQFILGYRGMIELARRSGQIISLEAKAVYQKDTFKVTYGLEPTLIFEPSEESDRGPFVRAYAVARLKGGGVQFDVMSKAEIDKIRARSKASSEGPWNTDYDEMSKKTVLRRLFKYLPISVEMQTAIGKEDLAEDGKSQDNDNVIEGFFSVEDEKKVRPLEQALSLVDAGDFDAATDLLNDPQMTEAHRETVTQAITTAQQKLAAYNAYYKQDTDGA